MSAALARTPSEAPIAPVGEVDREAVAFVLSGWSGAPLASVEAMLPPHLDRGVVRAQAAAWLDLLAVSPTAERIDALVHLGERRASAPRVRVSRYGA